VLDGEFMFTRVAWTTPSRCRLVDIRVEDVTENMDLVAISWRAAQRSIDVRSTESRERWRTRRSN
jgi:hypothetical protein